MCNSGFMPKPELRAIVFDLYDTLVAVDPIARREHQGRLAKRIGVEAQRFIELWEQSGRASNVGELGPTEDRFLLVLRQLGGAAVLAPSSTPRHNGP